MTIYLTVVRSKIKIIVLRTKAKGLGRCGNGICYQMQLFNQQKVSTLSATSGLFSFSRPTIISNPARLI